MTPSRRTDDDATFAGVLAAVEAREPAPEGVETAARAIWECHPGAAPWDELSQRTRAEYRRFAAAALSADAAHQPTPGARVDEPAAAVHGSGCQLPPPWFLRDVGWLADGEISTEDLHDWRIYLGGYDSSQPVPSEGCAYALIHEVNWRLASLEHAPNGLPVWVRAAGDTCMCPESSR